MPRVFKQQYTRPIPADAQRVTHKGKPAVRFKGPDGKMVVAPLTTKGDKCRVRSKKWYGRVPGSPNAVPLCNDKRAAEQMLNELVKKAEKAKVGLGDPFEE